MAAEAEKEGNKGSLVARVAAGTALILAVALAAALLLGGGPSYEDRFKEANAGWEYLNPSLVASRRLFAELT